MNTDQLINLIQTLFKVGGGALVAKGAIDSEKWEWITGLVMAVVTFILSHKWNATPNAQGTLPLRSMFVMFGLSTALTMTGCARFSSKQVRIDADGSQVTSKQTITTFFDAKSEVAKLRASTTDKTQGLTVGSINEESSGSNTVSLAEGIARGAAQGAVSGAVKSATP